MSWYLRCLGTLGVSLKFFRVFRAFIVPKGSLVFFKVPLVFYRCKVSVTGIIGLSIAFFFCVCVFHSGNLIAQDISL